MNEELKNIFNNSITVDNKEIPVGHIKYTGNSKTYIIWQLLDIEPYLFGDNNPLYVVYPLDVDIYSNSNYLNIVKEIKKILKENDWTWSEDSPEMYDDDTGLYHITCSFYKEGMI